MKVLDSRPSFEKRCPHCRCMLEIETGDIKESNGAYSAVCAGCKREFIIPSFDIPIGMRDAIDKQFDPY